MKKKILVAEDDRAILEVVKIILEQDGYETLYADKEEVIRAVIRDQKPDLILLDIWLGEAGADDFLLKPFNIDDLLNIVRKHLKTV
jgi:DNA-binding response OmpR family regulator